MGSNHDNHRGGLHGIQHVVDYYLYMFCVEQCVVAVMCATGTHCGIRSFASYVSL